MESLSAFQDAVQRDLGWRKVEISSLRTAVHRAADSEGHLFRAGQVLLCAHWEGFLKRSAKAYAEHALSQDLRLRDLSAQMVAITFFGHVMKAAEAHYPGSTEHHLRLAEKIIEKLDARPAPKTAWEVNTEGNPGTDAVTRILQSIGVDTQLGLDETSWSTTKVFINDQLVKDRNAVAHGEGLPIHKRDLLDRTDRTLRLLDQLRDTLLAAATAQNYLR